MNSRQSQLLDSIIKEYIETAEPVGSSILVSKYGLDISPATARNEMVTLEKAGYIHQPHTSAGRVPTEKGYKVFIQKFLSEQNPKAKIDKETESFLEEVKTKATSSDELIKNLARAAAEITHETIIVGFSAHDLYYTGISNFFRKPEFSVRGGSALGGKNQSYVINIAEIIDELDDVAGDLFSMTSDDEPKIFIGSDNPLNDECATIVTNLRIGNEENIFGLLGLMRMDYERNLTILREITRLCA